MSHEVFVILLELFLERRSLPRSWSELKLEPILISLLFMPPKPDTNSTVRQVVRQYHYII